MFALGDIVGVQATKTLQSNPWVMAFGVVILVLAVLVLIRWGFRRDEGSAIPNWNRPDSFTGFSLRLPITQGPLAPLVPGRIAVSIYHERRPRPGRHLSLGSR